MVLVAIFWYNIPSKINVINDPKYKYYEFGNTGFMERKGSINDKKIAIELNKNLNYKKTEARHYLMKEELPENLIRNLIDIYSKFCKEEGCKSYEFKKKEFIRGNRDVELYHYNDNVVVSVYKKELIYFTIPDESNRPSQCMYIVTNQNGDKSCTGLDEERYNSKYLKLIEKLTEGHEVAIEYNFDPIIQRFNYIITFLYNGLPSTIKWFLDFGPEGLFSFVGTNYKTEIAYNFKNLSFEKSLNYYQKDKKGFKLLPDIMKNEGEYTYLKTDDLLNIKKIGEVVRFYTDADGKLYLLPYYNIETDKGAYLLLASESK
jgi:hypothetical protein